MSFSHDTTGVSDGKGSFKPIPDGEYRLKVLKATESVSSGGYNMVAIEFGVVVGPYAGRKIWHNLCFLPADNAGAGIAKHWLHALHQPYEGVVDVDCAAWVDREIKARVGQEEYIPTKGKNANLRQVKNTVEEVIIVEELGEDCPF